MQGVVSRALFRLPLPHQLADKGAPRRLRRCWWWPPIAARFFDVALSAKRLQIGERPGFTAAPHRDNMIALQLSGAAAQDAAPPVALKDGASHSGPAAGIQVGVVATQNEVSRRRYGQSRQFPEQGFCDFANSVQLAKRSLWDYAGLG